MSRLHEQFIVEHRGIPVEGLSVQLLNDAGIPVVVTATGPKGRCVVRTERLKDRPAAVRFLDRDGRVVAQEKWSEQRSFELPAEGRPPRTLPIAPRRNGPILHHHHLDRVTRLLRSSISDDDRLLKYKRILDRLLPPLNGWDDILDTSARVLDGEPMSVQRFRQVLKSVRPTYFSARQAFERSALSHARGVPARRMCLLDAAAYQQLVMATAFASRDADEHTALAAQLEKGLAGIRTLERIVNAVLPLNTRLAPGQSGHIAAEQIELIGREMPGLTPPPIPDGGGRPEPPPIESFIPEIDLCEITRQECIPLPSDYELSGVAGSDGNYRIDSVTPTPAAAGSTLTLTGVNFGPQVSSVLFPQCGGGVIEVVPTTATQTEVTVTVPANATDGPISLRILRGLMSVCNRVTPIYEMGEPGYFHAASPSIAFLRLAPGASTCVAPGQVFIVEWHACPSGATVELRYDGGPWELVGNTGERQFIAPATTRERVVRVGLRATAPRGVVEASLDIHVVGALPVVEIVDVEFTQGIQTMFRTDGTPDNSLPLVANKDTVVRVYVNVDRNGFNGDVMSVTGEIRVSGYIAPLPPINSTGPIIPMGPFSTDDRNRTNDTLNFLLPAAICDQPLALEITVVGDWICDPKPTHTRSENISFRNVPAMPVRVRRIKGRAGNAPSADVARTDVVNAFTYLPSPPTNIAVLSGTHEVSWYVGLVGGYDSNTGLWILSQDISAEHWGPSGVLFDGAIWVGLTFSRNRGIMAWPDFWTCIAHAEGTGEDVFGKIAHEICHCLEFGHVRNGDESCNDWGMFNTTCEPAKYEGALPDVPFRVRNNAVISDARDLMSYAQPNDQFLNPEFWRRAIDEIEERWRV